MPRKAVENWIITAIFIYVRAFVLVGDGMPRENEWLRIRKQSLAVYMRNAGFDLAIFSEYSEDVQKEARTRAINEALYGIASKFEDEYEFELYDIDRGVYA